MPHLAQASVPVRQDLIDIESTMMDQLARPGSALTGPERIGVAVVARNGGHDGPLETLAHHLYGDPATVAESEVRAAADTEGDPRTVETIGIVSRLSAIDRLHRVLDVDLEPLPEPLQGEPTGNVADGLKRRRCHIAMPPGPIPFALDLLPDQGQEWREMYGPLYMTEEEMSDPHFRRTPGLDTPQLETVAARISLINECFY